MYLFIKFKFPSRKRSERILEKNHIIYLREGRHNPPVSKLYDFSRGFSHFFYSHLIHINFL